MRRPCLVTALLILAGVASAHATDPAPIHPTEACMAAAKSEAARRDCIGQTAAACRAEIRKPDPVDAAVCINRETEWWGKRLAAAYDSMMARAKSIDARNEKMIAAGTPRFADDVAALQTAWKQWSEKRCTFEAVLLRGSPNRMVAASECMLQQTAAEALLLERGLRSVH